MTNFESLNQATYPEFVTPPFFVSSFPVGSDTGVLQSLVLRLNSSISCKSIVRQDFPDHCQGDSPSTASYSNDGLTVADSDSYQAPLFRVHMCAPRNASSPWQLTGNRQDIEEEYFMDIQYLFQKNTSLVTYTKPLSNVTHQLPGQSKNGIF